MMSMSWTPEEEKSLIVLYQENKSDIEISRTLGKSMRSIGDKLVELRLDPVTRPIDQKVTCPRCHARASNIELLDFGISNGRWYYKCVKCDFIFQSS